MFTGIVQDIGVIVDIAKGGDWLLTIKVNRLSLAQAAIGASISCSGVCLTVVAKSEDAFQVQASAETLGCTTIAKWTAGTRINLEPALRLGDELGGHIVTGHVDGLASVISAREEGDSLRLQFEVCPDLSRFVASKGSVALDGVSLTVNEVDASSFGVNLIPHTRQVTTLGALNVADMVNFEVDMMARYAARLLRSQ